MNYQNVKVGDTVTEKLRIGDSYSKPTKGTVIYVHPKRRFFRAEFPVTSGVVREAFIITERKIKTNGF